MQKSISRIDRHCGKVGGPWRWKPVCSHCVSELPGAGWGLRAPHARPGPMAGSKTGSPRSLNLPLLIQTNPPLKPSATGITGLHRVTVSDLPKLAESSRRIEFCCARLEWPLTSPSSIMLALDRDSCAEILVLDRRWFTLHTSAEHCVDSD